MASIIDFGIGRRQQLLLTAALCLDKAEAAAALAEWWRGIPDLDTVRGTDSALFAQIYANLGSRIADRRLASRAKGAARHVWVRNNYMITDCAGIVGTLAAAGIPVMLLKGAAMAVAVDRGAGLRWMSDCDILVPAERAVQSVAVLADNGLTRRQVLTAEDLGLVHGLTLRDQRNGTDRIDIHWQPIRSIGSPTMAREMFAAAAPAGIGGRACLVPCFAHMVFHAIVHGTDWSPHPRYDWLVDTVKILRRAGPDFDWAMLRRTARAYRFGFLLAAALDELRRHFPDLVPSDAAEGLVEGPVPFERREARIRRASPSSRTVADELLILAQQERRANDRALRRPALSTIPVLYRSFCGPPDDSVRRARDTDGEVVLLRGWSAPEPDGRWTEGRLASVMLRHSRSRPPDALRVRAHTIASPAAAPQTARFHAGFRHLGDMIWSSDTPGPSAQTIALPAHAWRNGAMILRIAIGRPVVPAEIGLSPDPRALGIFVEDLRLSGEPYDALSASLRLTDEGALPFLWHGWSIPEPDGCWTFGERAILRWRTDGAIPAGHSLFVDVTARAPGPRSLTGAFAIDRGAATPFAYAAPDPLPGTVELPLPGAYPADDTIELGIAIDNPAAPADTIGGDDSRPLGLMIGGLRVAPSHPPGPARSR